MKAKHNDLSTILFILRLNKACFSSSKLLLWSVLLTYFEKPTGSRAVQTEYAVSKTLVHFVNTLGKLLLQTVAPANRS